MSGAKGISPLEISMVTPGRKWLEYDGNEQSLAQGTGTEWTGGAEGLKG